MNPPLFLLLLFLILSSGTGLSQQQKNMSEFPNILFAISDDQSFAHTGFAGADYIKTPAFDRLATDGVYFSNCIAGSPGCAPSRSSLVTGRYHWQNEQSGQHAASWMKKYVPFVDVLSNNGYITGRTGKGVSPFRYAQNENDSLWRQTDAAGIEHSRILYTDDPLKDERPADGIGPVNYFENFRYFMENVRGDKPFFFWYGATEPHRDYELDSWKRTDKKIEDADVPGFLPEHTINKGDMLDYAVEIEWFDLHLQRMINYLEEKGELDNTIIIVTSDNGMPFPRAKANCYEYGIHVPFVVHYPKGFPGGRIIDDLVGFADLAPTIMEITGLRQDLMMPISGESFLNLLESTKSGQIETHRKYAFTGRERHSSSRYRNYGYPQRAVRSSDFLLIWNMKPNRWPAGAPQRIKPGTKSEMLPLYGIDSLGKHHSDWAFTDIDAAPSKSFLIENMHVDSILPYFNLAHAKRSEWELFDIVHDPFCLKNLADDASCQMQFNELKGALIEKLKETNDPRITGADPEVFESYIRYSPMRDFPPNGEQ